MGGASVLISLVLMAVGGLQQGAAAAAAGAPSHAPPLPGEHDAASDAMLDWIKLHGGQVHVAIRRNVPGQGRGTYAPRAMQPGDVLASIPVELVYAANYSWGQGFEAAAIQLVLDMANSSSFWHPMLSALPGVGGVVNKEFIPAAYLPILQDNNTETAVRYMQINIKYYCDLLQPTATALGLTVNSSLCAHAVAILTTRTFSYGNKEVLLPVVDMANHWNSCPHTHRVEPCNPSQGDKHRAEGLLPPAIPPSFAMGVTVPADEELAADESTTQDDSSSSSSSRSSSSSSRSGRRGVSGVCIVWRAEAPLAAGEEVCNNYGLLTQDRSMLQYGFLQRGPIELELSMVDRPEHSSEFDDVWDKPYGVWGQELPSKFTGLVDELQQEADRLTQRLQALRAGDAQVAAIAVDEAADEGGRLLTLMLDWRQQRLRAIERETQRLQQEVAAEAKDEL